MEREVGDLTLDQDLEVGEKTKGVKSPSAVPVNSQDTVLVELLKTMQEQINASNKLLVGLVTEHKRPLSGKRNIAVAESDDELIPSELCQYGKVSRAESATISVAPHRQQ